MLKSLNTSKWYDPLWAALIFFTRLPFWRLHQPPRESFAAVVEYWPLTGWLTGGITALAVYFGSSIFGMPVALILAFALRLFLTGALHEDGLADFFDGFGGGGNDRARILTIMKDSHIGTYGVLGLVVYELLLFATLTRLTPFDAMLTIFAGDAFSKMVAGQLIQMMPYARTEEEAKNRTVYRRIGFKSAIGLSFQGLLPLVPFFFFLHARAPWELMLGLPCVVMYFLYLLIWRRLRGYTGDCCGALCLLVELSFYLTASVFLTPLLP